ncbi:MAG TPA: DNA-binding protein, partial [Exiguobacterium sp.]|nr:DNA-binding protein [Exiguobacterium sp.]
MNKTELIQAVVEKSGLTKKDVTKVVESTFESITETLQSGEKVQLIGFGNFE